MINCYFAPVYPQPATEVSIQEIFKANSQLIILILEGFFLLLLIPLISLRLPLQSMMELRHLYRAHSCLTGMLLPVIEGSQLMGICLYSNRWLSKTFNLHSINKEYTSFQNGLLHFALALLRDSKLDLLGSNALGYASFVDGVLAKLI